MLRIKENDGFDGGRCRSIVIYRGYLLEKIQKVFGMFLDTNDSVTLDVLKEATNPEVARSRLSPISLVFHNKSVSHSRVSHKSSHKSVPVSLS